jgi:demethylmenaquinone methyltransferase / 2-methoxy-6-polyprenyl-1,4-benzoquinol methylase
MNVSRLITRGSKLRNFYSGRRQTFLDFLFYLPWGGEKAFRRSCLSFLDLHNGDNVLDVCCGRGEMLLELSRNLALGNMVGVDIDAIAIESARNKTTNLPAKLLVADAARLPFCSSTFDACLISLGLHHAPPEQRIEILMEVKRVLMPGGRLYVFDYNSPTDALRGAIPRAFAWLDSSREAFRMVKKGNLIHEIRGTGFRIEKWKTSGAGLLQFIGAVSPGKKPGLIRYKNYF